MHFRNFCRFLALELLCWIGLLSFLFFGQIDSCGPNPSASTSSSSSSSSGSGSGTVTVTTTAAATISTTAPITCDAAEPPGTRGVNVADQDGRCVQTTTGTGCSCPGFDWPTVFANGNRYVLYALTTAIAGQGLRSSCGDREINVAKAAGLIVSPQHNAIPDVANGGDSARFFFANGGAWVADGLTLPGTLHVEMRNPGCYVAGGFTADCCYNQSPAQFQTYVSDFVSTYLAISGRTAIISTDYQTWTQCLSNWPGVAANPLVIANADDPTCGTTTNPTCPLIDLPWRMFTFWLDRRSAQPGVAQNPIFSDRYEGNLCKLQNFARG